jgi:hypothetical protein
MFRSRELEVPAGRFPRVRFFTATALKGMNAPCGGWFAQLRRCYSKCFKFKEDMSMEAFSPVPALIGGLLIGLASAILWIGNGRIAGISGIFGQLLPPNGSMIWRFVFLAALVSGAWVTAQFVPGLGVGGPGGEPARLVTAPDGWGIATPLWIALGGLLIVLGT